jgi:3-carboxy-cis,cis-muconate cycloisomerase
MRENLGATGGMILAENVTTVLSEKLGRLEAHDLVEAACRRALEGGGHLREEFAHDARVRGVLSEAEIDAALDPAGYLGSADAFVDRALALYREEAS